MFHVSADWPYFWVAVTEVNTQPRSDRPMPDSSIISNFWCSDKLVIVPDPNYRFRREMYEKAVNFWQKYTPVKIEISDDAVTAGNDGVQVLFQDTLAPPGTDSRYATIHNVLASYNEKINWYCHSQVTVEIFGLFLGVSSDFQDEIFAHEVGHVLGLSHRENTIMTEKSEFGFVIDSAQKENLIFYYRLLYPKVVKSKTRKERKDF